MRSNNKQAISTQIWRPPSQPSLEFASIAYEGFQFEPHFHEHFVIMWLEKGVNLGQRCRKKYEALPGEMLLIQPGEVHTGSSFENKALRYLAFYPDAKSVAYWLEKTERSTAGDPCFQLKYRNPALNRSFLQLFGAATAETGEALALEIAMLEFFETLAQAQPDLGGKLPASVADPLRFKKAVAYVREHFTENFSLDDLAAAVEVSPFHAIRLFRQHSGLTPFSYLRSYRVEQAKRLLQTKKSLTEVAYQSGFYDQSHFIRSFKKHTGFLPSDFRRKP